MSMAELLEIVLANDHQVCFTEALFGYHSSATCFGRGLCLVGLPAVTTIGDDIAGVLMN